MDQAPSTSKKHTIIPTALIHPFPGSLLKATDIYNVFSRQKEAETYLRAQPKCENLMIFAQEKRDDPPGRRQYIISTLERFLGEYHLTPVESRHFYEVIMPDRPCRLYFDLEFSKKANPTLDGEEMVRIFNKGVIESIQEEFAMELSPETAAIDLSASTADKFSRHLIYHFPDGKLLENYEVAFQFVQKYGPRWKRLPNMMVSNGNGAFVTFWDEGVYTRFRNFRLFQSSKKGKHNPLLPAGNCQFYTKATGRKRYDRFDVQVFYDALVSGSPKTDPSKLLRVEPMSAVESNEDSPPIRIRSENCREGYSESPYPEVDKMLLAWLTPRKPMSFIRTWKIFDALTDAPTANPKNNLPLIIYEIGNNRYCRNIEREHKSNNVMWVVDLEKGYFYQKCHDQECKAMGYRSNNFPIPISVLAHYDSSKDADLPDIVPYPTGPGTKTVIGPSKNPEAKTLPQMTTVPSVESRKRETAAASEPSSICNATKKSRKENIPPQNEMVPKNSASETRRYDEAPNAVQGESLPESPPMMNNDNSCDDLLAALDDYEHSCSLKDSPEFSSPILQRASNKEPSLEKQRTLTMKTCSMASTCSIPLSQLNREPSPILDTQRLITTGISFASPRRLENLSPVPESQVPIRVSTGNPTVPQQKTAAYNNEMDDEELLNCGYMTQKPSTNEDGTKSYDPPAPENQVPIRVSTGNSTVPQSAAAYDNEMDDEELLNCGYMTQKPSTHGDVTKSYDSDEEFMASLDGYGTQKPSCLGFGNQNSTRDSSRDSLSQSELELLGGALEEFEESNARGIAKSETTIGNQDNDSDAELCDIAQSLVAEGLI